MTVQVVVAVAGERGRQETEQLRDLAPQIERAVNGAVAQGTVMRPRNDVADFLYAIVNFLGADSGLGKLLKRVADFFEGLDPDGTKPWSDEDRLKIAFGLALAQGSGTASAQGLGDWFGGECMQQFLEGVRSDATFALAAFSEKFTGRLQEAIGCALQQNPQAQLSIPGLPQLDLSKIDWQKAIPCLLSAAGVYQNSKNVWAALWSFGTCMLAGAGGGGAQVEHETANRC